MTCPEGEAQSATPEVPLYNSAGAAGEGSVLQAKIPGAAARRAVEPPGKLASVKTAADVSATALRDTQRPPEGREDLARLWLINMKGCSRNMVRTRPLGAEMTEYVIREVGRHQWLVFADRQSIALCPDENEAVKVMTEHSASSHRSGTALVYCSKQNPPA